MCFIIIFKIHNVNCGNNNLGQFKVENRILIGNIRGIINCNSIQKV